MIHGHGSDAYKYNREIVADFSSNVWYPGPDAQLIDHLHSCLGKINTYPEPDCGILKNALAEFHNISSNKILITNGSAEAIYLLARELKKASSHILSPTFAEYEDACQKEGHHILYFELEDLQNATRQPNSIFWICNPNNPDGRVLYPHEISDVVKNNPESIFIIDEAYVDLCTENCSSVLLLAEYDNLIILKSFTKAYTIPGIRLGYILGPTGIINALQSRLFPWNVNTLAIEAGLFICDHAKNISPDKTRISDEMDVFLKLLSENTSWKLSPSATNYVLCELEGKLSARLKDYLVQEHGILIRDASNFHGLDDRFIRLALQSPDKNKLLINAINQFYQSI
jgi:threonine-phosphate decarboxylase